MSGKWSARRLGSDAAKYAAGWARIGAGTIQEPNVGLWAGWTANAPKRIIEPGNGMVDNLGQGVDKNIVNVLFDNAKRLAYIVKQEEKDEPCGTRTWEARR